MILFPNWILWFKDDFEDLLKIKGSLFQQCSQNQSNFNYKYDKCKKKSIDITVIIWLNPYSTT